MPQITFSLSSGQYDNIALAIKAYNVTFPQNPVVDENEFVMRAAIEAVNDYQNRYVASQIAFVKDRLLLLNAAQWEQVTSAIIPILPEAPTE